MIRTVLGLVLATAAAAAPGDLDPGFGGDGRVTVAVPGWASLHANAIHPEAGGEVLLTGVASTASFDENAIALVRLAADGTTIRSAVTPIGDDGATRAVRHRDGVVVGTSGTAGARILRFGPDDQPDATFGDHGVRSLPGEGVEAIAVQDDGGLVLATGWSGETCGDEGCTYESGYTLLRLDEHGAPDDAFGRVTRTLTGPGVCSVIDVPDVAVAADGDLLLAYNQIWIDNGDPVCTVPGAGPSEAHVIRLDARTGYAVDPAFGDHELEHGFIDVATDVDATADGRALIGGYDRDGPQETVDHAWVMRLDAATGAPETGFGVLPFAGADSRTTSVEQTAAGEVYLAAAVRAGQSDPGFGVARLTAAGAPDATFGTAGALLVDFGTQAQEPGALALAGDRLVVAGSAGAELAAARLFTTVQAPPEPTPTASPASSPAPSPVPEPEPLRLRGGAGPDVLRGGPLSDLLCGLGGPDRLFGGPGDDVLHGDACSDVKRRGDGRDRLTGGSGRDRLSGGGGDDLLRGGTGADTLDGGRGRDHLTGGPGADVFRGGPGADVINAVDGRRDVVACGRGRDRARVDKVDKVTGC